VGRTPRILATSGGCVEGPIQESLRLGSMQLDGDVVETCYGVGSNFT
jgi:hypothetical protein